MMNYNDLADLFRDACSDYVEDRSIFNSEADKVRVLKSIIWELDPLERKMLLAYAKLGSYRELGRYLDVSHSSARTIIMGIKAKVLDEFKKRQ